MSDTDASPVPALVLVTALVLSAIAGVLLVDSLITGRELRQAARHLRNISGAPSTPNVDN